MQEKKCEKKLAHGALAGVYFLPVFASFSAHCHGGHRLLKRRKKGKYFFIFYCTSPKKELCTGAARGGGGQMTFDKRPL